ncbi:MAG TPA: class I SAM-dependent methyltransferase, partial [Ignavibacteria bacterium]
MTTEGRKIHWDKIYREKDTSQRSWYEEIPAISLNFVKEFNLPKNAKIFDNGGGDSFFVDRLLEMGYENITVLDISEAAFEKSRTRLGDKAYKVKWIVHDQAKCDSVEQFDLWHDRAAFHFLTDENEI